MVRIDTPTRGSMSVALGNRGPRAAAWLLVAGIALGCNAVLGIEEAELVCVHEGCPDAAMPPVEPRLGPGSADAPAAVPAAAVGGTLAARDAGQDARATAMRPGVGFEPSGENDVELVPPGDPSPEGAPPGDDDNDRMDGAGGGSDGDGSGAGRSDPSGSGDGENVHDDADERDDDDDADESDDDDDDDAGQNDGDVPGGPCRGRAAGESFCRGDLRISCGEGESVSASTSCASASHCAAGTGPRCAACLPGEARCDGSTALIVCDATGTSETRLQCGVLEACVRGACSLLGLDL